jgi:outer membrane receptor protein involved in Fe transport
MSLSCRYPQIPKEAASQPATTYATSHLRDLKLRLITRCNMDMPASRTLRHAVAIEQQGETLSNVLPDKWIILAGLNWPTYNFTLGWRSSVVHAQNRVPAGGTPTSGYTLHDLTLTWLPQNNTLRGLRLDFGIDNLTDSDYRRHLSALRDPGRNYKLVASYQF